MSYTTISGMRSNRYPLMGTGDGLGCGCSSPRPLGQDDDSGAMGVLGIAAVGATAFGLLWYVGRSSMQSNRRRRRRRVRSNRRRRTSRRR